MLKEIMCCDDSRKIGATTETNFNGSPITRKEEKNEGSSKMRKEEKTVRNLNKERMYKIGKMVDFYSW